MIDLNLDLSQPDVEMPQVTLPGGAQHEMRTMASMPHIDHIRIVRLSRRSSKLEAHIDKLMGEAIPEVVDSPAVDHSQAMAAAQKELNDISVQIVLLICPTLTDAEVRRLPRDTQMRIHTHFLGVSNEVITGINEKLPTGNISE